MANMTEELFETATNIAFRHILDTLNEFVEPATDRGDMLIVAYIEDDGARIESGPLGAAIQSIRAMLKGSPFSSVLMEETLGKLRDFSAKGLVPILFIRNQEGGPMVQAAHALYVAEGLTSKGGDS